METYELCTENVARTHEVDVVDLRFALILVLTKLKTNLSFICLSVLFGISSTKCTNLFYKHTALLSASIKSAIYWPRKEEILANMPKCFSKFKETRVVLDCTEIKVQKMKCLNCRIKSYSHYKRCHTMKFLIGITPSGLISFVSRGYGGRATDKSIFLRENVLEKLDPHDAVMVDKGILIAKECEQNFIKLIQPPFLKKHKQLSKEAATTTAEIARARVHVERAIQRLKTFSVLRDTVEWYLIPYIDDVMTIIAATVNMSPPILADDKF